MILINRYVNSIRAGTLALKSQYIIPLQLGTTRFMEPLIPNRLTLLLTSEMTALYHFSKDPIEIKDDKTL
jgi:hypothetical protein